MDELANNNLAPVFIGGGMTHLLQPTDISHKETVQKNKEKVQKFKERAEQIRVERQLMKERAEQILEMQDEIPVWFSSQTEEETDLKQAEEKTRDGHEHEGGEEHTEAAHDERFRITLVDKEGLDRFFPQTQTEKKKEE